MQKDIQPSTVVHLLTAHDVAERLNIAKTAVYALLARGDLAHFRIGRLVRIREEDLKEYLDRCRINAVARTPRLYASYPED